MNTIQKKDKGHYFKLIGEKFNIFNREEGELKWKSKKGSIRTIRDTCHYDVFTLLSPIAYYLNGLTGNLQLLSKLA
jgi:hypothetical protein